jgi:hypothetical protein
MIEVATNYGPNPAPPRYVYLGRRQPEQQPEAEIPTAKAANDPKPVEWGDFLLVLMRTLMPFPDAREAVLGAIEAYDGASP